MPPSAQEKVCKCKLTYHFFLCGHQNGPPTLTRCGQHKNLHEVKAMEQAKEERRQINIDCDDCYEKMKNEVLRVGTK